MRDEAISTERLESALLVAAQIVALQGEVYIPIFERLESEVEARHTRQNAAERAKAMIANSTSAKQKPTTSDPELNSSSVNFDV